MIEVPNSNRESIISDLMPDLTPLLDVMFMLLIFFILTANAVPYALDVNLPEDNEDVTQAIKDPTMLSITLLPNDKGWKIDETLYPTEEAFKAALLGQIKSKKQVVIVGDKDVSMNTLLNVMAFLRKHNIEAADIVMEK